MNEKDWQLALYHAKTVHPTGIIASYDVRQELLAIDPDLSIPIYEIPYIDAGEFIALTPDGPWRFMASDTIVPMLPYEQDEGTA